MTTPAIRPTVGDTVRIYERDATGGRTMQHGEYVIVRANRHGDWTVRDARYGCTHDVLAADVEPTREVAA